MFQVSRDNPERIPLLERHSSSTKPKTEKDALLLSIEKWQFISNYYESGEIELLSDGGILTCGCCMLFFNPNGRRNCENCPIYNKTGKQFCWSTPYDSYAEIVDNYDCEEKRDFDVEEILKHAKAELKFLQDLYKELYQDD